jgi:hypothetical protein
MKAYKGVDLYIHVFVISALVGGEWSALHPGRFNPPSPRGRSPPYPWDVRLGGPHNRSGRHGGEKVLASELKSSQSV